jgi:4-diphosphocytidyl-2-C-methyl-D-erythritol kinase
MPANEAPRVLQVKAPAKLNLHLEVLGRRPDGFHEVRTVMQAVSLCDLLTFALREDGGIALRCSGADLPVDERNLVVRAALMLKERHRVARGAAISLTKRIPVGGGLGGGSADAAVALLALSRLWGVEAAAEDVRDMAARLGSDVPFFLSGGTALCEGRGERVLPLACGRPMHYVLVMPPFSLSTARVYAAAETGLTECAAGRNNVAKALESGDAERLGRALCCPGAAPRSLWWWAEQSRDAGRPTDWYRNWGFLARQCTAFQRGMTDFRY